MRPDYRIVLVEDEVLLLSVLGRMIKRLEPAATVQTYWNGLEAFHNYEQQGADLLIVSHGMPGMDGTTLIQTLRERGDRVPIVGFSGDPRNCEMLVAAGATVFVETLALLRELPTLLARFKPGSQEENKEHERSSVLKGMN